MATFDDNEDPGTKEPERENFSIMGASGGTAELGINMPSITGNIKYTQGCAKLYNKTSSSFIISRSHQ